MNEAGLTVNMLWFVESEYPPEDRDKPGLAISLWAQYLFDRFATVAEAVEELDRAVHRRLRQDPGHHADDHRSSLPVRQIGRQRDHRLHRRPAGDPPRPPIPGNDQFPGI